MLLCCNGSLQIWNAVELLQTAPYVRYQIILVLVTIRRFCAACYDSGSVQPLISLGKRLPHSAFGGVQVAGDIRYLSIPQHCRQLRINPSNQLVPEGLSLLKRQIDAIALLGIGNQARSTQATRHPKIDCLGPLPGLLLVGRWQLLELI